MFIKVEIFEILNQNPIFFNMLTEIKILSIDMPKVKKKSDKER